MILASARRTLAQYYLSLRMSAALAIPDLSGLELPVPTPIVRQLPARLKGEWDERELVRDGEQEWIVVREATREPRSSFVWN